MGDVAIIPDQSHACSRIAAINHRVRFGQSPNAHTMYGPVPWPMLRHLGPKGAHRLGRVQYIFTLKQAKDFGFPHRHGPKHKGPM